MGFYKEEFIPDVFSKIQQTCKLNTLAYNS